MMKRRVFLEEAKKRGRDETRGVCDGRKSSSVWQRVKVVKVVIVGGGGTLFNTTRDDDDIKKTLIKKDDFTLTFSIFPPKNGVKKVFKKILLFALEQKTRLSLKIGLEKERTSNHHHALRV